MMGTKIRILLVDDSENDLLIIKRALQNDDFEPVITRIETREEMTRALQDQDWDVILCDYRMPQFEAEEALLLLHESNQDIPFIIVSGVVSEETAVKLMKMGADDYLKKDRLTRLGPAIRREMKEVEMRRQKRLAQEKLAESERRYRMLVQSISDSILVVDIEGTIQEYHSAKYLCDIVSNVVIGETKIMSLFNQSVAEKYEQAIRTTYEKQTMQEFEFILDDTQPHFCHASLTPHEDGEHIVIVLRDISQLKRTEQELRATYRMAMLYLDLMSHDIRNYLQAMKIGIELVEQEQLPQKSRNLLQEVMSSIDACNDLISAVNATRDILQAPMKNVSLIETIQTTLQMVRTKHKCVKVLMTSDVDSAIVQADKYLKLLFLNLLENAVKHNNSPCPKIWIRIVSVDNGYEVRIADNGQGINDRMKKTLFDPNRRFGGVGIHQVVQLCEKYGGKLEVVDRDPNDWTRGAEFRVWLPVAQ